MEITLDPSAARARGGARRYRLMAVNDEASTCSCCGRTRLRRVVWLLDTYLEIDPEPYGTTCAAHLLLELDPGEPKPRMSAALKAIEAAELEQREAFCSSILADVLALEAPLVTYGDNEFGVHVAICGETQTPFFFRGMSRADPEEMIPRAVREWRIAVACARAAALGFDPRCGRRAAFVSALDKLADHQE